MDDLEHSVGATNVLNQFFEVHTVLFVEGKEDIPFWEFLVQKFAGISVKVQEVGGKKIEKYVELLIAGELYALVALDSDYSMLDEKRVDHANLLRTLGYSIENTIVCEMVLVDLIRTMACVNKNEISFDDASHWLEKFCSDIERLIYLDMASRVNGHGIRVLGDNCARFMESRKSPMVSISRVKDFVEEKMLTLDSQFETEIHDTMRLYNLSQRDVVRGHFLFSAALRFVSVYVEQLRAKATISGEAFFGMCLTSFKGVFDEEHPHYRHYRMELENIEI